MAAAPMAVNHKVGSASSAASISASKATASTATSYSKKQEKSLIQGKHNQANVMNPDLSVTTQLKDLATEHLTDSSNPSLVPQDKTIVSHVMYHMSSSCAGSKAMAHFRDDKWRSE